MHNFISFTVYSVFTRNLTPADDDPIQGDRIGIITDNDSSDDEIDDESADEINDESPNSLNIGSIGVKIDAINSSSPTSSDETFATTKVDFDPDGVCAQVDTGAWVTCTDLLHMLHGYVAFTLENPCPVKLKPATIGSDATPHGYGFLRVPAQNAVGFLNVMAFYTPILQTTVIDERDLIRAAGLSRKSIQSELFEKDYDTGLFTYRARH